MSSESKKLQSKTHDIVLNASEFGALCGLDRFKCTHKDVSRMFAELLIQSFQGSTSTSTPTTVIASVVSKSVSNQTPSVLELKHPTPTPATTTNTTLHATRCYIETRPDLIRALSVMWSRGAVTRMSAMFNPKLGRISSCAGVQSKLKRVGVICEKERVFAETKHKEFIIKLHTHRKKYPTRKVPRAMRDKIYKHATPKHMKRFLDTLDVAGLDISMKKYHAHHLNGLEQKMCQRILTLSGTKDEIKTRHELEKTMRLVPESDPRHSMQILDITKEVNECIQKPQPPKSQSTKPKLVLKQGEQDVQQVQQTQIQEKAPNARSRVWWPKYIRICGLIDAMVAGPGGDIIEIKNRKFGFVGARLSEQIQLMCYLRMFQRSSGLLVEDLRAHRSVSNSKTGATRIKSRLQTHRIVFAPDIWTYCIRQLGHNLQKCQRIMQVIGTPNQPLPASTASTTSTAPTTPTTVVNSLSWVTRFTRQW